MGRWVGLQGVSKVNEVVGGDLGRGRGLWVRGGLGKRGGATGEQCQCGGGRGLGVWEGL